MTDLLLSELRRFRSRRVVLVLTGLALLAIAVAGVIVFSAHEFALEDLPEVLMGTSLVFVAIGWVLGASAIGAEWHTGHITTLLTWEPRRARMLGAKIAACLVSVFVLSFALQIVLGAVLAFDAATRGSTAGVDGAWLAESLGVVVRVSLLATFFGGFGFGLASIGRNTAVALGVGFGYLVIVENLVRGLRPRWIPWLLTENAALFVIDLPGDFPLLGRSTVESGLYLGVMTVALLVAAGVVFRVRDVN
jgi:ABC-type transport system involved in multi-copper enzyme maturation permease subunit